jgi:hypothetical protein
MNKRILLPGFLQRLDEKLLRNKPTTWQARTHLVLFYAALFAVGLTAFCFMVFFDARHYSELISWSVFIGIIAFIGIICWLIFLLRFNVFKRYGNWKMWDGLKSFALYFTAIGAIVAVCFIPSAVQTYRANQQFTNDELVHDINALNTSACKLEYDLLDKKWRETVCKVVDDLETTAKDVPVAVIDSLEPAVANVVVNSYITNIDTSELRNRIIQADSLKKVNDSVYIFYECPHYNFVGDYNADNYTTVKQLDSKEIYYTVLKDFKRPNATEIATLIKRMQDLKSKYASAYNNRYSYYYENTDYDQNDTYEVKIKKKYALSNIESSIHNVVEKKYNWKENWGSYLRAFYYIAFILTMFVFAFRHTTIKTFFLSLLAGVLLAIFTGLIIASSYRLGREETVILSFIVLYWIVFGIIAFSTFTARQRRAIHGIAINIFFVITPFVPLLFVSLNDTINHSHYNNINYDRAAEEIYRQKQWLYFLIAEITGFVLFIALLEPLFRKLYRRWYSLPEN